MSLHWVIGPGIELPLLEGAGHTRYALSVATFCIAASVRSYQPEPFWSHPQIKLSQSSMPVPKRRASQTSRSNPRAPRPPSNRPTLLHVSFGNPAHLLIPLTRRIVVVTSHLIVQESDAPQERDPFIDACLASVAGTTLRSGRYHRRIYSKGRPSTYCKVTALLTEIGKKLP